MTEVMEIKYTIDFEGHRQEVLDIRIDATDLVFLNELPENLPEWTLLEYYRCPNCLLDNAKISHCPVATNLADVIDRFKDVNSYDKIQLKVKTRERLIIQDTTAQRGISSLAGLLMATSSCPHTSFFRSMARFHLPLANTEETVTRAVSMYLLSQYFKKTEGNGADFDLKGLKNIYENVQIVNSHMTLRLQAAIQKDSTINAVILLDMLAQTLPMAIDESLNEISYLFEAFLRSSSR